MQSRLLSLLFLLFLTASCQQQHTASTVTTRRDAEKLMAGIRPGMSVAQIERAIPHSSVSSSPVVEHGGVWYDMAISDDYSIQFRVALPRDGRDAEQGIINHSPRLRDRKTLAFISGEERPW